MGWKANICVCAVLILASTYVAALVNNPRDNHTPGDWVLKGSSSSSVPMKSPEGFAYALKLNGSEAAATLTVAHQEGLDGGTASAYVKWTMPPKSAKEEDAVDATVLAGFKGEGETLADTTQTFGVAYSSPGCATLHKAGSMGIKDYYWQHQTDGKDQKDQASFKYTFPSLVRIYLCSNYLSGDLDTPEDLNERAGRRGQFQFTMSVRTSTLGGTTETNYTYEWVPKGSPKVAEEECAEPCECDSPYYGKAVDTRCRFNSITGQVEKADCGANPPRIEWHPVTTKSVIYCSDHIMTGDDSWSIIQLEDMSTYILKENTEITIDTPPTKDTKIGLVLGRIYINTVKMFKDGTLDVEMAQGGGGIKGTTLVCEETGKESTIKVIEGVVEFTSKKDGKKEMVKAGEKLTATKDGFDKKEKFDIEAEKTDWAAVKAKAEKGSKPICNCIPLIIGGIALLGAALGSKIM
jgi:hypothetical protein